jgi:hypothetical protein
MILEIFVPTGPNNFFKHVQGIEAILAARGPPTSSLGADIAMLSGVRILCIFGALVQQRPSIWATDEWKSVPPLHSDEGSLIRHEILSILADCTVLNKGYKPSSPLTKPTDDDHCQTASRVREYLGKLQAAYVRWERHNVSMLEEEVSPSFRDPTMASAGSAATYLLYNSAFICTLRILSACSPPGEQPSLHSLVVAAAWRIVRCMELKAYENREGSGESNTIGFLATKVAWDTLGGFSSPGGRRLSRAVKAAANGVFAVGAWDEPEEPSEPTALPYATGDVSRVTSVYEQTTMAASSYNVIELIDIGEKHTFVGTVPFDAANDCLMARETAVSPSQVLVAQPRFQ